MNWDKLADEAISQLRHDLDASKFTPEEWATMEWSVQELTLLTIITPTASDSQVPSLRRRFALAKVPIGNYSVAKAINIEGAVHKAIRDVVGKALKLGLATLEKVLVNP